MLIYLSTGKAGLVVVGIESDGAVEQAGCASVVFGCIVRYEGDAEDGVEGGARSVSVSYWGMHRRKSRQSSSLGQRDTALQLQFLQ